MINSVWVQRRAFILSFLFYYSKGPEKEVKKPRGEFDFFFKHIPPIALSHLLAHSFLCSAQAALGTPSWQRWHRGRPSSTHLGEAVLSNYPRVWLLNQDEQRFHSYKTPLHAYTAAKCRHSKLSDYYRVWLLTRKSDSRDRDGGASKPNQERCSSWLKRSVRWDKQTKPRKV